MSIKVAVSGVFGKMGQEVVKAVEAEEDLELVGMVDVKEFPEDLKSHAVTGKDLSVVLKDSKAEVMVDFTQPDTVMKNIETAIVNGVSPVVGTTGLSKEDLDRIHILSEKHNVGVIIAPNFALGAILMMHYAAKIAKYMPHVEIIELHHNKKLDAPSGTAIKTAQLIAEQRDNLSLKEENSARGDLYNGINVHSIRLPGLVAHQEVIFGGQGQTLTIRHDTTSREAFMPGVIMAIREAKNVKGVIYGLENLLDL
jgi:4-hydroxy-tetrahydrodipicolinate reductase